MSVYRAKGKGWRYRARVKLPDGSITKISGTCTPNTKAGCEAAELLHTRRVLVEGPSMGRPPVVGETRDIQITIRVNETEDQAWAAYARANGFESVRDAVRDAMNRLAGVR